LQPPADEPVHRPLNLSPELIDKGPEALVEQMKRAQKGKISGTPEPVFEQPRQKNLSKADQQVAGSSITDVNKEFVSKVEAEFLNAREVTTIKGSVGKLEHRLADTPDPVKFDDNAVKLISEAFGANYGPPFNQLHAWGRILGDTTAAGRSIGPDWVNHLQLRTVESFLQSGKEANRIPLIVRTHTKNLVLNQKTYRFFRSADYEFTLGGEVMHVNIEMTAEGAANMSVSKGGMDLGKKLYKSWDDLPDWFQRPDKSEWISPPAK